MAVHQYIGARYVPYYYENSLDPTSTEWEPNVHYEALTVVTLPNNHSYISKKDVPDTIGTPAANAGYWLDTGSDNAYIQQLSDRLDAVVDDMASAFSDSATYNVGDIVIYEDVLYTFTSAHSGAWDPSDVTQTDLISLFNDFKSSVEGIIDDKIDRNILIIGNSYVNQGLCNILEESFKNHYHFTGSGIGFVPYTGHSDDFEDALDSAISDTSYDHNSITDILIVSAAGDTRAYTELGASTYVSNLETKLSAIESKISSNYSNATRIGVVLGESRTGDGYDGLRTITSIFKIHKIFNTILGRYRFEYIGWAGFNIMFAGGMMESDAVHLTALGYKTAGTWLARAYFGNANYIPYIAYNATAEIRYTASSTVKAQFIVYPDQVIAKIASVRMTPGDAVTISDNNTLFVGTATAINLDKPIPGPGLDDILYADFVDPYTGNSVEKCRLQITAATNGILRMIYFGTPRATVPSGVNYMAAVTLYNYGYNI